MRWGVNVHAKVTMEYLDAVIVIVVTEAKRPPDIHGDFISSV